MSFLHIPVAIYLLKVNNRITRTRCNICSKLTIKTPDRGNPLVCLISKKITCKQHWKFTAFDKAVVTANDLFSGGDENVVVEFIF